MRPASAEWLPAQLHFPYTSDLPGQAWKAAGADLAMMLKSAAYTVLRWMFQSKLEWRTVPHFQCAYLAAR